MIQLCTSPSFYLYGVCVLLQIYYKYPPQKSAYISALEPLVPGATLDLPMGHNSSKYVFFLVHGNALLILRFTEM